MAKSDTLEAILSDLRSLDSKIGLIAQKIKTMENNEEVIGRTLIALNARLRKLEEQVASGAGGGGSRGSSGEDLEKKFATKQELKEMRYVLDNINPLDYATISQVRELINEKLGEFKAIRKKAAAEEDDDDRGTSGGAASALFKKI